MLSPYDTSHRTYRQFINLLRNISKSDIHLFVVILFIYPRLFLLFIFSFEYSISINILKSTVMAFNPLIFAYLLFIYKSVYSYCLSSLSSLSFSLYISSFTCALSFLKFCTGSSHVRPGGFASYRPTIAIRIDDSLSKQALPHAHTCFHEIVLPVYPSEAILREKVMLAIREGNEGFDIK